MFFADNRIAARREQAEPDENAQEKATPSRRCACRCLGCAPPNTANRTHPAEVIAEALADESPQIRPPEIVPQYRDRVGCPGEQATDHCIQALPRSALDPLAHALGASTIEVVFGN